MKTKISCYKCKYLKITWQPQTPYACQALGFKSRYIPSLEVFKNSGIECQSYSPKEENK